jgi:hypothetical protein
MLKDDALKLRERLAPVAARAAEKAGVAGLADDGKLYHDEVGEEARWAQRLAPPGWPHAAIGAGTPARPGLRLEVWYRPGKPKPDEQLAMLLVCADEPALAGLRMRLEPVWATLLGGGKAAGRYKAVEALEPLAVRLEPGIVGIARHAPVNPAKAEAALAQLVEDALKPVAAAVAAWAADGGAAAFEASPVDPLAALRAKFGQKP